MIDPVSHDVWIDAQCLTPALSHKQYQLPGLINDAGGKIVSHEAIGHHLCRTHASTTLATMPLTP